MDDPNEPVLLFRARDPIEAQLVCGRLESEGVPAHCRDLNVAHTLWHQAPALTPGGVPVMVRRGDLAAAKDLLARWQAERTELAADFPDDFGQEEAPPTPAELAIQRITRASWATMIAVGFLFAGLGNWGGLVAGLGLAVYSTWLLWRGRRAWREEDHRKRLRNRVRMGLAALVNALLFLLAGWIYVTIYLAFTE